MSDGPMFNAYPDSLGGKLSDIVSILEKPEFKDVFQSFYILPSIYQSDLDRGFSVTSYNINENLGDIKDLENIKNLGIDLKLDFILNHLSVQSMQFQDIIKMEKLLFTKISLLTGTNSGKVLGKCQKKVILFHVKN